MDSECWKGLSKETEDDLNKWRHTKHDHGRLTLLRWQNCPTLSTGSKQSL